MSIASSTPCDRSRPTGVGNRGVRNSRKVDSSSHAALLYGSTVARKAYVRVNAFDFALKPTCPPSSSFL